MRFDTKKLTKKEKAVYDRICEEVLSKKHGEPYDVAKAVFADFETKAYKNEMLRDDLTG